MGHRNPERSRTVFVRGQKHVIRRTIQFDGQHYGEIRQLTPDRPRYLVYDEKAGPKGDLRAVHIYARSPENSARLAMLSKLNDSRLPMMLRYHPEGGRIYVLLNWVPGVSLDVYLDSIQNGRNYPPSPFVVIRMFRNLAHAVRKVNDVLNIVHGDLKPANVIVPRAITNLTLIDFGSAWCVEESVRQAGRGDGITRHVYASPEQRQENVVPDFRSDLFSVAVIVYQLLTGKAPYNGMGGGAGATPDLASAYTGSLLPPSQFRRAGDPTPSSIWHELDRILMKSLQLDRNRRYSGLQGWAGDIDHLYAITLQKPKWGWLIETVSNWMVGREDPPNAHS